MHHHGLAVHLCHAQVGQHDVDQHRRQPLQCLLARRRSPDHLDIWFAFKHRLDTRAHNLMIIHYKDSNCLCHSHLVTQPPPIVQ
jgi:hypothetical protein